MCHFHHCSLFKLLACVEWSCPSWFRHVRYCWCCSLRSLAGDSCYESYHLRIQIRFPCCLECWRYCVVIFLHGLLKPRGCLVRSRTISVDAKCGLCTSWVCVFEMVQFHVASIKYCWLLINYTTMWASGIEKSGSLRSFICVVHKHCGAMAHIFQPRLLWGESLSAFDVFFLHVCVEKFHAFAMPELKLPLFETAEVAVGHKYICRVMLSRKLLVFLNV